jgi:osmotically-inducible protein OsmY
MNIDLPTLNPASETDRLEDLLSRRLGSRIRDLRVVLQQAGMVLRGWTETYYAKQVAQHAVMELSGVPILANEIEVR